MSMGAPKLLSFVPCERVIIGGDGDGTASTVGILQGFNIGGGELPSLEDAESTKPALPMPWYFFSLWDRGEGPDQEFEQRFELQSPTGKALLSLSSRWSFQPNKRFHRLSAKVNVFPLAGVGDYRAVLFLKVADGEFVEQASFPIPVNSQPEENLQEIPETFSAI